MSENPAARQSAAKRTRSFRRRHSCGGGFLPFQNAAAKVAVFGFSQRLALIDLILASVALGRRGNGRQPNGGVSAPW